MYNEYAHMARIALNGFGRIGRLFFRKAYGMPAFDVVAVNDLGDVENLAYLLAHDTVYGKYERTVRAERSGNNTSLSVDGKNIPFLQEKDPVELPWKELGVDIVVEATGVFESFEGARAHLAAGAKRAVLTAPAKDADGPDGKTVLVGINEDDLKTCVLSSNGSCTTNAVSPIIAVLDAAIGVERAVLNTIHAYTATQSIVDGPARGMDFRRGRAGAQNMAPSSTGAAIAVGRAIRSMQGKFDGIAVRVPVAAGSLADTTFVARRPTTVEEINQILTNAAADPRWAGIMKVTNDQIVSSDIIGEPYGAIVDLSCTRVVDGTLVKVFSWYDNEAGYVSTLLRHVARVASYIT